MTRIQYNAIHNWNHEKTFKNFLEVYRHGFDFRFIWWRPVWRVWRIFRNTVLTDRYIQLEKKMAEMFN